MNLDNKLLVAFAFGGLVTLAFMSGFGSQTIVDSPLQGEIQGNLFGDVCARLSCIEVDANQGGCLQREYVPRCEVAGYVPSALQLEKAGLSAPEPALVTAQPTGYAPSIGATGAPTNPAAAPSFVPPVVTPTPGDVLSLACKPHELLVNGACVVVPQSRTDAAVAQYNQNAQLLALAFFVVVSAGFYFFSNRKK